RALRPRRQGVLVGAAQPPRRDEVFPRSLTEGADGALVARVLPDISGLDKEFDYLVPPSMVAEVRVGTLVRVELHGRRVGGWVVAGGGPDAFAAAGGGDDGRVLKRLAKGTGG